MLTDLLARLHPVLVHFPIALLATAWLFEFARRRAASEPRPGVSRACLSLGAVGALAAAGSGWLAGEDSPYERSMPGTLGWHRWLGVALAACAVLCVVLGLLVDAKKRVPYRGALTVLVLLVTVVGHLGGTLVHGEGFVLDAFRTTRRTTRDPESDTDRAPVHDAPRTPGAAEPAAVDADAPPPSSPPEPSPPSYARDIAPLFALHCIECHGPERHKGGLRLDAASLADELAAPGDPPLVVPGDPAASELVRRVELSADDPDRMPDKAPPLSAAEQALLRAWVEARAPLD